MTVKVEVENIEQHIRRLKQLEDGAVSREVNKGAADIVLRAANISVPRGPSGKLRRSGRASGTKSAGVVRYGTARVPYATNVHFGDLDRPQGGFILPNPWAYDAADSRRREVFKHYDDQVAKLGRRLF